MEKELELKLALFEVSSRDKADLLEQIESLEAQKKTERNGGLREVQRKEELFDQIGSLEINEKALVEEREHAMISSRAKNVTDIKDLREEMDNLEADRIRREYELRQTFSELVR
jgi:hypothetical protein